MSADRCSHCSVELASDHSGPCPECGKEGKMIYLNLNENVKATDSLLLELSKTYFEKHPVLFPIVTIATIGSPFIGLFLAGWLGVFVGLAISIVCFVLGSKAVIKVIAREREKVT